MSTAKVKVVALHSPNRKEQGHFNLSIEIVLKKKADSVVKERQTEEYEADDCIVPPMSPDIELPFDKDKKCEIKFAIDGVPCAFSKPGEYMKVYSEKQMLEKSCF
ncbi:hypothetical protein MAR_018812 [Mya arenaria]|uniref:Uncharacterized protein n=1 Tax=Mya arenaria TaxID=6604 RepID=A0ABY7EKC2_MYAAR|nr:hypothetical protein MAR_018812 [Mya arenaria]